MSIPSLNHLSAIQCSQARKRYRNASIIDVSSLLNQTNLYYGTHRLIYLTKQIPAGAFTNVRGLFCMWNFVDCYDTRLTMGLRLQVSATARSKVLFTCSREKGKEKIILK